MFVQLVRESGYASVPSIEGLKGVKEFPGFVVDRDVISRGVRSFPARTADVIWQLEEPAKMDMGKESEWTEGRRTVMIPVASAVGQPRFRKIRDDVEQ